MKIGSHKLTTTETWAAAALLVSVVSQGLYALGLQSEVVTAVKWISFLIFAGSIFLLMHEVSRRLRELKEVQESTARDIVDAQERAFTGIAESNERSLRAFDVAETTWHSIDIHRWNTENPDAIHVEACTDVASNLLANHASLIERVHRHTREGAGRPIYVPDYSPIHELTGKLAEDLPQGGVWLGITLVDDERAWSSADQVLNRFAQATRTRAQREQITVLRLYSFGAAGPSEPMRECLAREHRNGIRVRYQLGIPPRDMSLLYAPPPGGGTLPALDGDVNRALIDAGYSLLCALEYDTREGGTLRSATIYTRGNTHVKELLDEFDNLWSRAAPYPEEQASGTP